MLPVRGAFVQGDITIKPVGGNTHRREDDVAVVVGPGPLADKVAGGVVSVEEDGDSDGWEAQHGACLDQWNMSVGISFQG